MTLLDFRSFGDRAPNTAQPTGWGSANGMGYVAGRFAGSYALSSNGSSNQLGYTVPAPPATIIVGAAYQMNNTSANPIMFFNGTALEIRADARDGSGNVGIQVYLNAVLIASSPLRYSTGVWRYLEIKVVAGVGGSTEVRLDGTPIITIGHGAGTVGTTISSVGFRFGSNGIGAVSDIYILDTAGSAPFNNYLGDVRCDYLVPNGNVTSQLLGSDSNSTDNYLLVDETPPSTTDYVGSATIGQRDLYAVADMPVTANTIVHAVKAVGYVFKSDAGTAKMKVVLKSGASEATSSDATLSTTLTQIQTPLQLTKPGGGAWTTTDVNAVQVGAEVVA